MKGACIQTRFGFTNLAGQEYRVSELQALDIGSGVLRSAVNFQNLNFRAKTSSKYLHRRIYQQK